MTHPVTGAPTVDAWDGVRLTRRLGGGYRNEVWAARRGGQSLVARRSRRGAESLTWELDLLEFLRAHAFAVPECLPARDGRRHVDGVVVQTWLDGEPPAHDDWPAVVAQLRRLHELTAGWPQRPGHASTVEMLTAEHGGDVDLRVMPGDAVVRCRAAWAPLVGWPTSVVHGDPGAANIRLHGGRVGLLDWDEARVDAADLDLADLPVVVLSPARHAVAHAACHAWEAANAWRSEPEYARRRLAALTLAPPGDRST